MSIKIKHWIFPLNFTIFVPQAQLFDLWPKVRILCISKLKRFLLLLICAYCAKGTYHRISYSLKNKKQYTRLNWRQDQDDWVERPWIHLLLWTCPKYNYIKNLRMTSCLFIYDKKNLKQISENAHKHNKGHIWQAHI